MNKKLVRELLLKKLEEVRGLNLASYQSYKKASNEAPGAMESHSDTSKFQLGVVGDKMAEKLAQLDEVIVSLRGNEEGTIIQLKDTENVVGWYYLVPDGAGGQDLELDNEKIKTITPSTPLGKLLLNKKAGDSIELVIGPKTKRLEIISVE